MLAQWGGVAAGRMHIAQVVVAAPAAASGWTVTLATPVGERDPSLPLRGRRGIVERILRLSGHPADGRMHVLHGLSGAGKTAVALEVVTRVRAVADRQSAGPRIWWIDARHPAAFAAGMREVARQAGVGDEDVHAGHVVDALWENLGRAPYRWLLIVDGADDLSLLDGPGRLAAGTGWLRPHHCPDGLLLVTTQSGIARLWGTGASLHAVGPLSTEELSLIHIKRQAPGAAHGCFVSGGGERDAGAAAASRHTDDV